MHWRLQPMKNIEVVGSGSVLSNFWCCGILLIRVLAGQEPAVLDAGAGWGGCFYFFLSHLSYMFFSLSWETAQHDNIIMTGQLNRKTNKAHRKQSHVFSYLNHASYHSFSISIAQNLHYATECYNNLHYATECYNIPYKRQILWYMKRCKAIKSRYEPQHDKTNKMTYAPSEDSDQPGQSPKCDSSFRCMLNG